MWSLPRILLSQNFLAGFSELLPDPVKPRFVLGLHQDRTQTGYVIRFGTGSGVSPGGAEPPFGQLYKREVEIAGGAGVKNPLGEVRRLLGGGGLDPPNNDVELRHAGGERLETGVGSEAALKLKGGAAACRQALSELAARDVGEQALSGPEGRGSGAGPGALEADLAEVEIL
jgi:hypothetical protein